MDASHVTHTMRVNNPSIGAVLEERLLETLIGGRRRALGRFALDEQCGLIAAPRAHPARAAEGIDQQHALAAFAEIEREVCPLREREEENHVLLHSEGGTREEVLKELIRLAELLPDIEPREHPARVAHRLMRNEPELVREGCEDRALIAQRNVAQERERILRRRTALARGRR